MALIFALLRSPILQPANELSLAPVGVVKRRAPGNLPEARTRKTLRRFTRLTNGLSKKIENHEHSVALNFMHYNFAPIHNTLRVTPAMEAGLTDLVWEIEELLALLD